MFLACAKNSRWWQRALVIFIGLHILTPAYGLSGFSHRAKCDQVLNKNFSEFETFKKTLQGNNWSKWDKANFTFMEFNVLNMVEARKKFAAKPLEQLEGVARVFKKYKPMLAFCVEVGSAKVLKDYDQEFLGDQYEEFLIEGNDRRKVNVGLMLRKDLSLEVEVQSHKNLVEDKSGEWVFSRDLPTYILREKGNEKPIMIIFGTHFKSQRRTPGDLNGFKKRSQQAKAASLLIADYEKQYPGVPIILTGDFNNDVRSAPEFDTLKNIGLVDAFDVAKNTVVKAERGTHFYFPRSGEPNVKQLDAIMLNQAARQKLLVKLAKVLAHIDPDGNEYPAPHSYQEREERASDHLPIMAIFDLMP
jgi:hypothetical protein